MAQNQSPEDDRVYPNTALKIKNQDLIENTICQYKGKTDPEAYIIMFTESDN